RADEVGRGGDARELELLREVLVRTGRAVGVHDVLREKVRDRLAVPRLVGPVDVVEGAVLSDDDDEVLDRSRGGDALARIVVTGEVRGKRERWPRLECDEPCECGCGEAMGSWSFHEQTSVKTKTKTTEARSLRRGR